MSRLSWEQYAFELAKVAALRSEDEYVKVGSCALGWENQVLSLGYNGAPPGINIDFSDRDERRKRVLHSELNCLRYCKPGEVKLLAVTLCPCSDCMKQISAYKIKHVVFGGLYDKDDFGIQLAYEFGIKLEQIELPKPPVTQPKCTH